MGLLRVGHDWVTSLSLFTFMHWRRKWQPTPVFLPGEYQGQGSLVGLMFSSISLHWSLRKAFLSLLAILWNSAFRCLYLSFSPLLFASLLYTAICKASPDSHFAFLHFFSMGMVLIPVSCTMSQTSLHSSSVVHIHNGVLLSHQKEYIWISSDEVDETGAYYIEWSKPERKTPIQCINPYIYTEFRKMVTMTLYLRQQKIHRDKEQTFGLCGRRWGWDDLRE